MPNSRTKLAILLIVRRRRRRRRPGLRIKDITEFEGARSNQLTGIGLVVGLENTGGRSLFTQQMAVNLLCATASTR